MKRNHSTITLVLGAVALLLVISAASWAAKTIFRPSKIIRKIPVIQTIPVQPDEALIERMNETMKIFDPKRAQCTFAGTIQVIDHADTAQNLQQDFLVARKADNFYMKQGEIQMLGENGTFINIDDKHRKVFLSHPQIMNSPVFFDADMIRKALVSENYQLTSHFTGSLQKISLINEHHFSCKEYSITYDTLKKKVVHIYSRLANPSDPMSTTQQKTIDIRISQCDTTADMRHYISRSAVLLNDHQLSRNYRNYELVAY